MRSSQLHLIALAYIHHQIIPIRQVHVRYELQLLCISCHNYIKSAHAFLHMYRAYKILEQ